MLRQRNGGAPYSLSSAFASADRWMSSSATSMWFFIADKCNALAPHLRKIFHINTAQWHHAGAWHLVVAWTSAPCCRSSPAMPTWLCFEASCNAVSPHLYNNFRCCGESSKQRVLKSSNAQSAKAIQGTHLSIFLLTSASGCCNNKHTLSASLSQAASWRTSWAGCALLRVFASTSGHVGETIVGDCASETMAKMATVTKRPP
jgi:hypothetical protein